MSHGPRWITHEGLVALRQRAPERGPRLADLKIGTRWHIGASHGVVVGKGQAGGVLVSFTDNQGGKGLRGAEWSGLVRVEVVGPGVLQEKSA